MNLVFGPEVKLNLDFWGHFWDYFWVDFWNKIQKKMDTLTNTYGPE